MDKQEFVLIRARAIAVQVVFILLLALCQPSNPAWSYCLLILAVSIFANIRTLFEHNLRTFFAATALNFVAVALVYSLFAALTMIVIMTLVPVFGFLSHVG